MATVTITIAEQEVPIDPESLSAGDAMDIEVIYGGTWDEFNTALTSGSMKAAVVFMLVLAKRTVPSLRLEDIKRIPYATLMSAFVSKAKDDDSEPVAAESPTLPA